MPFTLSAVVRPLLGLSADEFPKMAEARFGPSPDLDATWQSFEPVASTLVETFYSTLDDPDPDRLTRSLDDVQPELRGIAYEGAGMGLMFLDLLNPLRKRLPAFVHGAGAPYRSLVYIGAGLVLARAPGSPRRYLRTVDPFHRWYVMDGYGFFDGFFRWDQVVSRAPALDLPGYASRAYDQGLGRSLWFASGADVGRILGCLQGFSANRLADIWGGLGLACAYAAGVLDRDAIAALVLAADEYAPDFATGAAVASTFRRQTGQPAPHTDLACEVIWRRSSDDVAQVALEADLNLRPPLGPHSYGEWRSRIRSVWAEQSAPALSQEPAA
jgi:hypothetical protein